MVEVEFQLLFRVDGGWSDKTKLILISTLVEVVVEVGVELGNVYLSVHLNVHHYQPGWWWVGGWWVGGWGLDFTRLMLISTQVEVVVEVGVELGNSS